MPDNPTIWRNNTQYGKFDPRRYVDVGFTEFIADKRGKERDAVTGGSQNFGSSSQWTIKDIDPDGQRGEVQGVTTTPPRQTGGGNTGGGGTTQPSRGSQPTSGGNNSDSSRMVDNTADAQRRAAEAAAEAKRQAAQRSYQAKVGIANSAKDTATKQYNWLIDTIGSNKKDLLEQVAFNEGQGLEQYGMQEEQTRRGYDTARQEILTTYRDLQKDQEKIMRGSGMSQSSRSQEAQLRLNNLLGKDLSTVSTNEADSLALIGNAVSSLKEKSLMAKNSIEREANSKLDKAAIDYDAQIQAINNNLTLSANEKEDAYAAAEAQLATDIANVETWATGLKLQQQQAEAKMKEMLDGFIVNMTDEQGLLTADLNTKVGATNEVITQAGFTPLEEIEGAQNVTSGVYQKAQSKDELDKLLASGQINEAQYNQQLAAIQTPNNLVDLGTAPTAGASATLSNRGGAMSQANGQRDRILAQDPLLAAMFA